MTILVNHYSKFSFWIDVLNLITFKNYRYDRGSRSREGFSDRDRERERERPRDRGVGRGSATEPIRNNRMPERDHRDRYANDSRGKGKSRMESAVAIIY